MSIFDKLLKFTTEAIKLNQDVKHLAEAQKVLDLQVRELDRRLVRIETMIEMARSNDYVKLPPST